MNRPFLLLTLALASLGLTSCQTTYNARQAPEAALAKEGSLVFVRPDVYSILGTRSIRDYIEITYERAVRNDAGLLNVEIGFRNRGAKHWYDLHGPDFPISVKTTFFQDPVANAGPTGAPVYESNWQTVTLLRGDTAHFRAICLVPQGKHYQVTVSERLVQSNK